MLTVFLFLLSPQGWNNVFYMLITADVLAALVSLGTESLVRGIGSKIIGRALDCRAGGRRFDSRGRTNTQGLKITEK